MIDKTVEAAIRRLYFGEHFPRGTVATSLGVHPDVVKRVVGQLGNGPKDGSGIPSTLDPYKSFVVDKLADYPKLRATRVYDMIEARGYTGSLRTLRRYVAEVRPTPKSEVFLRMERLPGEQAQVDWGYIGKIPVRGGERALWLFVMVLAYSRAIWGELVLDLSVSSLCRSLTRAAEFFGGVTRQFLFDNPKVVVIERHGDLVRFQPDLLELCSKLHVEPRLCAVRKPQQKGGVERGIRYLKERFFAARSIRSVERGNAELLEFLDRVAMERAHPTIPSKTVREALEDERRYLLALANPMPSAEVPLPVVVDKTAFAQFDCNKYSVPPEVARKTITVVGTDTEVKFVDGEQLVALHERCWGKKHVIEDPNHRAAIITQKAGGGDLKGRDRLRGLIPKSDELMRRWLDEGLNVGTWARRTLRLIDLYGTAIVAQAIGELLERDQHNFGALSMLCEQKRRPKATMPRIELGAHIPDRDVPSHDHGGYDEAQRPK